MSRALLAKCFSHGTTPNNIVEAAEFVNPIKDKLCSQETCSDFRVGEERIYCSFSGRRSQSYPRLIKRDSSNEYSILIPLNLKLKSLIKDQSSEEEMIEELNQCIESHEEIFNSPEGVKLNIRIVGLNGPASKNDRTSRVVITSKTGRSHSLKIKKPTPELNCGLVVHEMLHHLGLVDEYKEFTYLYGRCRALGPFDSIMNNSNLLNNVDDNKELFSYNIWMTTCIPQSESDVLTFQTDRENFEEKWFNDRDNLNPSFCKGLSLSTFTGIVDYSSFLRVIANYNVDRAAGKIGVFKLIDKKNIYSPIKPAHFRAILHPNCQSVNRVYNLCAKYAYKYGCLELPEECQGEDWVK